MFKTEFKAHPITIINQMTPYLFVLIIPLARAIFQYLTKGDIDGLLTLELLAFAIVMILAIIGWRAISVCLNDRYLVIKKGVLIRSCAKIEVSHISSVSLKQTPIDFIVRSVSCYINTEAGTPKKSDFCLKMHKKDAETLFKFIYGKENKTIIKFSAYKIALFSATTSNAATGIIIGVPIINQASKLLGIAISDILFAQINSISTHFNTLFPPIVNIITIILLLAYLFAFFVSFFKNANFKLQSRKNEIDIESGIVVKNKIVFKKSQVNNICLEQTPLLRIFKKFSMRASIGGYGDMQGKKSVVIPVASHSEIESQFKQHFPVLAVGKSTLKPAQSKRSFYRFIYIPTIIFLLVLAVGIVISYIFPYFRALTLFLTAVALCIDLYYANICCQNYKYGGLCFDDCIFASGSVGFTIRELYCDKNKIGVIKILQTPADRKFGSCKVKLTVRSEAADSVRVRNLDIKEVKENLFQTFNL